MQILEKSANLIAKNPCWVFWISMILSLLTTAIPFFTTKFEVDFTVDAFTVRGNDVANTQLMIEALEREPHNYERYSRRERRNLQEGEEVVVQGTTSGEGFSGEPLAGGEGGYKYCLGGGDKFISTFFKMRDDSNILTTTNIDKAKALQDEIEALPQTQGVYMSTVSALSGKSPEEFSRILGLITTGIGSGNPDDFRGGAEHFFGNCNFHNLSSPYDYHWVEPGKALCRDEEWMADTGIETNFTAEKRIEWNEDVREDDPDRAFYMAELIKGVDDGVESYFQRNFSMCHPFSSTVRVIVHACEIKYDDDAMDSMYNAWGEIAKRDGEISLVWGDNDYTTYAMEQGILGDTTLLVAVAPLVFVVICLQTRSLFISVMGFFEIIVSFGLSHFFYKSVLGISYFQFFNFLGLFVLFGIGADDIFIITDAWKQSAVTHHRKDLEGRTYITLQRAVPAIFATSLTTAAAFFGNMISNIPPLRLFGLFTGMMVLFDWLLTITFLASVLVIHEKYLSKKPKTDQTTGAGNTNEGVGKDLEEDGSNGSSSNLVSTVEISSQQEKSVGEDDDQMDKNLEGEDYQKIKHVEEDDDSSSKQQEVFKDEGEWRWIEVRFEKTYMPWLNRNASAVLLLSTIFVGVALNIAVNLEPLIGVPQVFRDGHNEQNMKILRDDVLPERTYPIFMELFYGLEKGDGSSDLDPKTADYGVVTFDEDFSLASPESQEFFIDTCMALVSEPTLVRSLMDCFMLEFKDYVRDRYSGGSFPNCEDAGDAEPIGFPVPEDEFGDAMLCFNHSSYKKNDDKFGLDEDGTVQWATIKVWSRLQDSLTIPQKEAEYHKWKAWVDERNEMGKDVGLGGALFTDQSYEFMSAYTLKEMQSGVLRATMLSLALAFFVIIACTRNLRLTLFAIFSVFAIVVSMIALMVLLGYKLGALEAMALTILVGISIDYTLHLALAYVATPEDAPSDDRIRDACKHAGISVLSGAVTTSLSGLVLIFSTITFFSTFGLFILATALFSIVSALTIFTSLCSLFMRPRFYRTRTFFAFVLVIIASVVTLGIRMGINGRVEPLSSEVKTMDFTFPTHELSGERTQYMCSSFVLSKSMYLKEVEILDNVGEPSVLHHLVVMQAVRDFGTCPFTCFDMPEITGYAWAWALGADDLKLEPNQYMSLHDVVVIQIHYDNYMGKKITDMGSGVRVHYTEVEPSGEGVVQVGSMNIGASLVGDWVIPPGVKNNTVVFDTQIKLLKEVAVRGWSLHIHQLGVRGRLEIYRDGKFVSFLGCMGYSDVYGVDERGINGCTARNYDFDYQLEILVDGDIVLKPGDTFRHICEMDSTGRDEPTGAGFASNEEMCQTLISVYPSENILVSSAFNTEATLLVSDGNITIDRRSMYNY